jgi:hypothetical protein
VSEGESFDPREELTSDDSEPVIFDSFLRSTTIGIRTLHAIHQCYIAEHGHEMQDHFTLKELDRSFFWEEFKDFVQD